MIEHIDYKRLGNGAQMAVISGGIDQTWARIVLKSRRGSGINSMIRIYGQNGDISRSGFKSHRSW